jgi:hypothetical protein
MKLVMIDGEAINPQQIAFITPHENGCRIVFNALAGAYDPDRCDIVSDILSITVHEDVKTVVSMIEQQG